MSHICHARGCRTPVKPELLMCPRHWRLVPLKLQRAVYQTYRRGQCDDKRPSRAWHDAAGAAIGYVALLERQVITRGEVRCLLLAGYEEMVVERYERLGRKEACVKVLGELKEEMKR